MAAIPQWFLRGEWLDVCKCKTFPDAHRYDLSLMLLPDKAKGMREAARVLKECGCHHE
jgi:hypothetical protein